MVIKLRNNPIIAVAQIQHSEHKEKENVKIIKKYISLAKQKNADIVCFPEFCIYGAKTMHFDDKFLGEVKEECKKNSIWCILTEDFYLRGKHYNMAVLINRKGKIIGNYKKIHLYGDSVNVQPGKKTRIFKTDFAKIGIAICWDLAFPDLFKKMKKSGAEIVFCPSGWAYEEKAHKLNHKENEINILRALVLGRAFENLYFVALINPVRKHRKDQVAYSAISSPHRILKEIRDKEGLIVSEIDLREIKNAENLYPN